MFALCTFCGGELLIWCVFEVVYSLGKFALSRTVEYIVCFSDNNINLEVVMMLVIGFAGLKNASLKVHCTGKI